MKLQTSDCEGFNDIQAHSGKTDREGWSKLLYLLVFGLSLLSLSGVVFRLFIIDWVGRRPLALTTFTIIFIIDVVIGALGFADANNESVKKAIAAFSLLPGFFFAAGFGSLTYIVSAEMPTTRLRNATSTVTLHSIVMLGLHVFWRFHILLTPMRKSSFL
ncbi:hypothetical protein BKA61DRAFT_683498 [Leptodontidium sp. MPI-SDFR-AT-0119]|nr:hypothetical protein BKA61DRAFT_683498 [Leptodontidium sp. MPI-SDFR-AT-0119]